MIELTKLRPIQYKITLDGRVIETAGALVSIGNGVSLAMGAGRLSHSEADSRSATCGNVAKPIGSGSGGGCTPVARAMASRNSANFGVGRPASSNAAS